MNFRLFNIAIKEKSYYKRLKRKVNPPMLGEYILCNDVYVIVVSEARRESGRETW